jgi:cation diffusion facilitator CzcD-associated flavoprotein CzcO
MDERYPDFPHHTEINQFLHEYADRFSLREGIRFNTAVENAERLEQGGWRITTSDGEEQLFDALLVCNGHHWDPSFPEFPGRFDGETLHSHHYIDPNDPLDLTGKRVLVVGIGNSAVDITSELARKGVAERVFISTRSGAWVVPKYVFGRPADQVFKTNPRLPLGLQRRIIRLLPRLVSGRMEDFGLPTPNHNFLEAHPTVSSELLLRLGSGDAVAKPDVAELEGDRVRFTDGSVEPVDAIVYATGYKISFPFFDTAFISAPGNVLPLYKRIFKPGIDDLAFVGFAQAIPTIFPMAESQSKLVGRWLAGDWALPTPAEMEREIAADERRHMRHFTSRPRHTMELDYYVYEHDLEKRVIPEGQQRARSGPRQQIAGRAALAAAPT